MNLTKYESFGRTQVRLLGRTIIDQTIPTSWSNFELP